jgi:hypothetical protein
MYNFKEWMKTMERNIALDMLKFLMALMVVGLHTGFLGDVTLLGEFLTVNGVFRIAVPVFLIINGFYFFPVLSKGTQIVWLKRVLILYVVWMLLYSYYWFSLSEFSLVGMVKLAKTIVFGYYHLWYLSGMLGAAFILLILRRFESTLLMVIVLFCFLIGVLIQYAGNYHYFEGDILDQIVNLYWVHRNFLFFSFPFFAIGYLIHKHSWHEKISIVYAGLFCVLGLLLLLGESYLNYYQDNRDGGFDNYLALLVVCPFIFIFFNNLNILGKHKNIALYSSAIYFIHLFFFLVLSEYSDLAASMLTIAVTLLSILASYFIIKINHKVKVVL